MNDMNRRGKPLWAPWRMEYILGTKPDGCVFCDMPRQDDDKRNYILYRGKTCYVILNLYPYNNGHLMVAPFRHISDYTRLDADELAESAELVRKSVSALEKAFKPDGFNIGMNLGRAGGAGIEEHLHQHIVPRWNGDFNYMPVIGNTRVIPQSLDCAYQALAPNFS